MRDGRGRLLSALGLAVLVALSWWLRLVHPGRDVLFANSDLLVYYYPLYDAAYAWLARGVVPLWNPYQLCGIPWLATLQGGFFYPGHVLYLLLPTHVAMAAASLLHFLLLALSMAALARRVGLGPAAAGLAALLLVLRGALPQLVLVPNYLEAAAWLPLGAIAVHGLVRGEGVRAILRLTLATAMSWLAGCPQVTVYLLYAWGTLLLALLVGARAPLARWVGAGSGALADSFYPGWQATVDGRAAAIVPVNHLFRGVAAAAGTHRVRFEYRPASVRYGALISLLGLVVAAGAAVAARRA